MLEPAVLNPKLVLKLTQWGLCHKMNEWPVLYH